MKMNIKLIHALPQHKEVIENLMQLYMYDFSEFVDLDVESDGLFPVYKNLADYWTDKNRFPYVIQKEKKIIGFVLVKFIQTEQQNYFSMAEFFIMKRYRQKGIGKTIATQIFDAHKGEWEVFQKENNKPAQLFWNKVINEYTKGNFSERFEDGKMIQEFIKK
jgi:predicted acetyltransferase